MKKIMKYVILLIVLVFIESAGAQEQWTTKASMHIPRAGAAAVVWDGKIYVFGGKSNNNTILKSVEVYDPVNDTWDNTTIPDFNKARYNGQAIVWKNEIYLIGGRNKDKALKDCEVYDPVQNEWHNAHNLHEEREGHAIAVLNKKIFAIGGQNEPYELVEDIEWYNADDDNWVETDSVLPYPRVAAFNAVIDNIYYMLGGYYYGLTNSILTFQPDTNGGKWRQIGAINHVRYYGVSVARDSSIYLFGGETADGKTDLVEKYNVYTQSMTQAPSMPNALSGMAGVLLDEKIYIIGGFKDADNTPVNQLLVFNPELTAIENPPTFKPDSYLLFKAWPSPFNGRLTLSVDIKLRATVKIDIFNLTGARIRSYHISDAAVGRHFIYWDALDESSRPLPSGPYFIRVRAGSYQQMLKVLYVK